MLRSGDTGHLSATQLRELVLLATGSEAQARRAFLRRAADQLDAGQTPS